MGLLSFSPESLATINIIPGYYLGPWPVLLIIGLFLVIFALISKGLKFNWLPAGYADRLIILFFFFWLILSLGFTGNNYNDWLKNKDYRGYSLYQKSLIRVCGLDNPGGRLCRIFSDLANLRKQPDSDFLVFESNPIRRAYLNYYSFPKHFFKEPK